MAIELVTGYQGKDHVTADQWADFNRGIFGKDTILPIGNRMETAIQTANQITVKDGVAVIDGRQVYIGYGESENIVIQSGTQGMLRRDIVVLEYNKDESGVESVAFKVITGEPKASGAVDPSVENTDIRTGVSTSQKPFCRVRLNGTAIEGVDALIPVREFKPHAFEDTVKDFTATETGHIPDATLTKKLKDDVNELNGKAAIKTYTSETLNLKSTTKLNEIIECGLLPRSSLLEFWVNDDAEYKREIRKAINTVFSTNFYGFCFIYRSSDGTTRLLKCIGFDSFKTYVTTYTEVNSVGWMESWIEK